MAAADGGIFGEHGLDVEFVDCVSPADRSLRGYSVTLKALPEGVADFALSSVAYLLAGQTEANGRLQARFAAVFHQRNPIAGLVLEDSNLREPEHLAGRRLAGQNESWFAQELQGALAYNGLEPASVVKLAAGRAALEQGEVDAIPAWVDMTPGYRGGVPIRAIPLDIDVYATGLVAADRLPLELVTRMRDAMTAGYELQRSDPDLGITAFRRRFPNISEDHLRAGWSALEPYLFDGSRPGSMDAHRWETTIEYTAATHGLSVFPAERLYRPELIASALEPSPV
ncbi:MAG: ABC transporter substrate-binding protein [Solirubrobacteraceae bacterium]